MVIIDDERTTVVIITIALLIKYFHTADGVTRDSETDQPSGKPT